MAKVSFSSVNDEKHKVEELVNIVDEINFKSFAFTEIKNLEDRIKKTLKDKNISANLELIINLEHKGA